MLVYFAQINLLFKINLNRTTRARTKEAGTSQWWALKRSKGDLWLEANLGELED
jgi:hypothetical protein